MLHYNQWVLSVKKVHGLLDPVNGYNLKPCRQVEPTHSHSDGFALNR